MVDMDPERQRAAAGVIQGFSRDNEVILFTCRPNHAEMLGGHPRIPESGRTGGGREVEIRKVAVIGMGTMGSQIGIVCARAGFRTEMADVSEERVRSGMDRVTSFLDIQGKKRKMEKEEIGRIHSLIGNTAVLTKALVYILSMGAEGLREATVRACLNANFGNTDR